MKVSIILIVGLLLNCSVAFTQFNIVEREQELATLLDSLRASKNDAAKKKWNTEFKTLFASTLNEQSAYDYPFASLTSVGKIASPDKLIRIINWNVEQDNNSQIYYAFVLKKDERKPEHKVIELIDNSIMFYGRSDEQLESTNWYGALYYQIIPVQKSNKTIYTVLGWDGAFSSSNIKIIDAISFTGNSLKIGVPIFKSGDITQKRVYLEHSEKSVMTLRWDEDQQRILFDHLSPETPTMKGFYEYYVPDFSYDAFEYQNNKWVLIEDVIGINKDREKVQLSYMNEKTGEVEQRDIQNKWIDPTSSGSPSSKEVHTANLPEESDDNTLKKEADKVKKTESNNALDRYEARKRRKKERELSSTYADGSRKRKK